MKIIAASAAAVVLLLGGVFLSSRSGPSGLLADVSDADGYLVGARTTFTVGLTNATATGLSIDRFETTCGCMQVLSDVPLLLPHGEAAKVEFAIDGSLAGSRGTSQSVTGFFEDGESFRIELAPMPLPVTAGFPEVAEFRPGPEGGFACVIAPEYASVSIAAEVLNADGSIEPLEVKSDGNTRAIVLEQRHVARARSLWVTLDPRGAFETVWTPEILYARDNS
ncbi:MAG: hypothetical protein AAGB51_03515 [Planctomycetota bacterium]